MLLVLVLAVDQVSASCFGKDAHFKTTDVSLSDTEGQLCQYFSTGKGRGSEIKPIFKYYLIIQLCQLSSPLNVFPQQPLVSQVSRTDPQQVLVSWERIIKRPECVDRYHVWVWPEGTERTSRAGRKILVEEKEKGKKSVATSKTVTVEPCLNYK